MDDELWLIIYNAPQKKKQKNNHEAAYPHIHGTFLRSYFCNGVGGRRSRNASNFRPDSVAIFSPSGTQQDAMTNPGQPYPLNELPIQSYTISNFISSYVDYIDHSYQLHLNESQSI